MMTLPGRLALGQQQKRVKGSHVGILRREKSFVSVCGSGVMCSSTTYSMISQLFQPPGDVLKCLVLCQVVDEKGSNSTAVCPALAIASVSQGAALSCACTYSMQM
jgi:hypothetical protein